MAKQEAKKENEKNDSSNPLPNVTKLVSFIFSFNSFFYNTHLPSIFTLCRFAPPIQNSRTKKFDFNDKQIILQVFKRKGSH